MTKPSDDAADSALHSPTAARRWQFSLRDLLIATTVIGVYLASCVALIRDWTFDRRTLMVGVPALGGALFGIAYSAWQTRPSRQQVLVSLPQKTGSLRTVATDCVFPLVVLATENAARSWLGWTIPETLSVGLLVGLMFGCLYAVHNSLTKSIYLMTDGIAFGFFSYFPWRRVHGVRWLKENELEISFLRGMARRTVRVTPAQRPLVESILRRALPC